jgi:HEAT repeat protein
MLVATLRSDSEQAFEPNIEQIGNLLSDSEVPVRKAAIFILGNTKPHMLPAAALALKSHLRDKSNSVAETLSMTAALLKATPAGTSTVHTVLGLVGSGANPALKDGIIRQLGLFQVESEEALSTVKAGLDDSDSDVRKASLDAISRMNANLRVRFTSQLTRIAGDSQEKEDVRQLANKVLTQSQ